MASRKPKPVTKAQARKVLKDVIKLINRDAGYNFHQEHGYGKHVYNILAALRGPDTNNSEGLKWATTAKIRVTVGLINGLGIAVNHSGLLTKDAVNAMEATDHFKAHIYYALDGLKALGFIK